jgi:rSAM/selenodomain-associated transferase 2
MTDGTPGPALSVLVPALNAEETLPALLRSLASHLAAPYEVIVADGGSADDTVSVALEGGARVLTTGRGRGRQLAAAAATARAPLLCALRADVAPTPQALRLLDGLAAAAAAGAPPSDAFAFRLAIDAPGRAYRLAEWGANARARWLALPYGDQGLIVARTAYDRAGGYPAIPIMEDVALGRALRRVTRLRLLPAAVAVSPLAWERDGVLRRTVEGWRLLVRYLLGEPPERLARAHDRALKQRRLASS